MVLKSETEYRVKMVKAQITDALRNEGQRRRSELLHGRW